MDSTSLCFTHVNPQHLHQNYNPSEDPCSNAINHSSESFWEKASTDFYECVQFGHLSLMDTPFTFRAVPSECSISVDESPFLSPPMSTNEFPIPGNELALPTSASVEETIHPVPEVDSFVLPYCSSENDDIFRQFQINEAHDSFFYGSDATTHIEEPDDLNGHLIEGTSTRNEMNFSQELLPPQKKTKGAPEVTAVQPKQEFICEICGRKLCRVDSLRRHIDTCHHSKEELYEMGKLFICENAGCRSRNIEFGFPHKLSLTRHMKRNCKFRPRLNSSKSAHSAS